LVNVGFSKPLFFAFFLILLIIFLFIFFAFTYKLLYIPILEQFLNKNTPIVVNLKKDKEESLEFGGSFGGFLDNLTVLDLVFIALLVKSKRIFLFGSFSF
jgi:hypothetical protein